ncbi:MAG: hypothetical protein Q8L10_01825 [Candidatus Moranbacteria bacterium]|nr:hypothetical protein [Candidatus Moranbacteria bacterium]
MKNKPDKADFLAKCSVCGKSLDPDDIVILSEKEQKTTMHVTCAKCRSAAIVFLLNNQLGVMSVGMATDLDSEEVASKFGGEAINSDEILDLYQFVDGEGGDIMRLIKNGKN